MSWRTSRRARLLFVFLVVTLTLNALTWVNWRIVESYGVGFVVAEFFAFVALAFWMDTQR